MTKKEMNELADLIVDKLLTTYIREQATWYTTSTKCETRGTTRRRRSKVSHTTKSILIPRGHAFVREFWGLTVTKSL